MRRQAQAGSEFPGGTIIFSGDHQRGEVNRIAREHPTLLEHRSTHDMRAEHRPWKSGSDVSITVPESPAWHSRHCSLCSFARIDKFPKGYGRGGAEPRAKHMMQVHAGIVPDDSETLNRATYPKQVGALAALKEIKPSAENGGGQGIE